MNGFKASLLSLGIACALGGCGEEKAPKPASTPAPTPTPTPAATSAPTPAPPAIVNAQIAAPNFAVPGRGVQQVNSQANFEVEFPFLTAWANCVTYTRNQSTSASASCQIKSFRILEQRIGTNARTEIARANFSLDRGRRLECVFDSSSPPLRVSNTVCRGALYRRQRNNVDCWFNYCVDELDSSHDGIAPMTNSLVQPDDSLTIFISQTPDQIAHWWTYIDTPPYRPTSRVSLGFEYFAEIQFYTTGNAAVQVGLDRWTIEGQPKVCVLIGKASENCQVWFSDWYSTASSEYRTLLLRLT